MSSEMRPENGLEQGERDPVVTDPGQVIDLERAKAALASAGADSQSATDPGPPGLLRKLSHAVGMRGDSPPDPETISAEQVQRLRVRARSSTSAEPTVADELSTALGLAHQIRAGGYGVDLASERLEFILDCLLDDAPKLTLARDERLRLQFDIYRRSGIVSRSLAAISAGSSVAMVIAALIASLVIWGAVVLLVSYLVLHPFSPVFRDMFFMNGQMLIVVAFGAFIGGVISIATRLGEFSRVSGLDPLAMFLTAMFKPLIGVILSVFILSTLAGGVITLGFLDGNMGWKQAGEGPLTFYVTDKALYILFMLSFLAGFSERFAWDFVDRAQGIAQGTPAAASSERTKA